MIQHEQIWHHWWKGKRCPMGRINNENSLGSLVYAFHYIFSSKVKVGSTLTRFKIAKIHMKKTSWIRFA